MLIDTFTSKALCCTPNCQQIFSTKKHVLLGISPFNSYYNETTITLLMNWALETFEQINIFIPDNLPLYNFLALGYEREKAVKKAEKQARYLKNKILRAGKALGLHEDHIYSLIIDMDVLQSNTTFTEKKALCYELFENEYIFREECLSATQWILNGYQNSSEHIADRQIAVRYLREEMPLFLDTPSILKKSSSLFCYHQTPDFIKTVYNENNRASFLSLQQGFIEVVFENQTLIQGECIQHETRVC